jgi:hypothetical protein
MKTNKRIFLLLALGLFLLARSVQADWQPAKRLTWISGDSFQPRIAGDSSGNLHVVWYASVSGDNNIYYKQSTDAGATWSGMIRHPAVMRSITKRGSR